jgi:hypothetical protein
VDWTLILVSIAVCFSFAALALWSERRLRRTDPTNEALQPGSGASVVHAVGFIGTAGALFIAANVLPGLPFAALIRSNFQYAIEAAGMIWVSGVILLEMLPRKTQRGALDPGALLADEMHSRERRSRGLAFLTGLTVPLGCDLVRVIVAAEFSLWRIAASAIAMAILLMLFGGISAATIQGALSSKGMGNLKLAEVDTIRAVLVQTDRNLHDLLLTYHWALLAVHLGLGLAIGSAVLSGFG